MPPEKMLAWLSGQPSGVSVFSCMIFSRVQEAENNRSRPELPLVRLGCLRLLLHSGWLGAPEGNQFDEVPQLCVVPTQNLSTANAGVAASVKATDDTSNRTVLVPVRKRCLLTE